MSDPQPGWGTPQQPYPASHAEPRPDSGARAGVSVVGFFLGVLYVIVVPGIMVTVGSTLWPEYATPGLIFTGLVTLSPPLALLGPPQTRRFAGFVLIGMAVTLLAVAAIVLAFLALLMSSDT